MSNEPNVQVSDTTKLNRCNAAKPTATQGETERRKDNVKEVLKRTEGTTGREDGRNEGEGVPRLAPHPLVW